jgi:hypothetical protein
MVDLVIGITLLVCLDALCIGASCDLAYNVDLDSSSCGDNGLALVVLLDIGFDG